MSTTLIKNAGWAIAWDASEKRHVYRKGMDVAFGLGGITHSVRTSAARRMRRLTAVASW